MRIISKFKDYYDSLQSFGKDSGPLYMREQRILTDDPELYEFFGLRHSRSIKGSELMAKYHGKRMYPYEPSPERYPTLVGQDPWNYYTLVKVIFCGSVFNGIQFYHRGTIGQSYKDHVSKYYWSDEEFLRDHQTKKKQKISHAEKERSYFTSDTCFSVTTSSQIIDFCHKYKTPIIALRSSDDYPHQKFPHANVKLQNREFYKAVDVNTTFQELSMFLGGVLSSAEEVAPASNETKIQAHGLDERSFRRDPTKVHHQ